MRISRLAEDSGVPLATVKFYLREGLLHAGARTSATQADYDQSHLQRLALIRALIGQAGLSVSATRAVLHAVDSPPPEFHDLLGHAHSVAPRTIGEADARSREDARELIERSGWSECDGENQDALAGALSAVRAAEIGLSDVALDEYAAAMSSIAASEVARTPTDSPATAVRYVVLGTVLVEPVLLAMRRLAQESASRRLFLEAQSTSQAAGADAPDTVDH